MCDYVCDCVCVCLCTCVYVFGCLYGTEQRCTPNLKGIEESPGKEGESSIKNILTLLS
jgi:hypothetical protein